MTIEEYKMALSGWELARGTFCSYGAEELWAPEVQRFYARVTAEIDFNIAVHQKEISRLENELNATQIQASAGDGA